MKNKFYILLVLMIFLNAGFVTAHGEDSFAQAEEIIKQEISCDDLTENQFEILGDYYMEQMHPGEQHTIMDKMMGGEGSESLKQVHINIGISFYCGKNTYGSGYGMMNTMMGRNMMTGGMMNYGYYNKWNYAFIWLFNLLLIATLILIIILIIKQINKPKRKRK